MTITELQKIFPTATEETWHQHSTGGGWVKNTANVAASAYVGPIAQVYGDAKVYGDAWVYEDGSKKQTQYWNELSLTVEKERKESNEC